MKIREFIDDIKKETTGVDYKCTRDHLLVGNQDNEIKKIGVCWTATYKALQQAKEENINFIISHENPFYIEGTHIYQGYYDAKKEKEKYCIDNDIAIYRLHDGWDSFVEYGIVDSFTKTIDLPFQKRNDNSFYRVATIDNRMDVKEVAQKIIPALKKYNCNHVEILGKTNLLVNKLVIGCGAITNLKDMLIDGVNAVVLSDDGCTNWVEQQYCLDHDIAVILVHHSTSEMAGIDGMQKYFTKKFPHIETIRLDEGYQYTSIQ